MDVDIGDVDGGALLGQSVYNVFCDDCHGADGEGVTAVSLNNPWFHEVASDGHPLRDRGGAPRHLDAGVRRPAERRADRQPGRLHPQLADGPQRRTHRAFRARPRERRLEPRWRGRRVHAPRRPLRPAAEVEDALRAGQRFILIDARPTADYLESHISGATSFPFYDIDETSIEALARDAWVITYCGCPHAVSGQAADALLAAGFERVAVLDEGFYYWEEQGWPLTSGRETGAE